MKQSKKTSPLWQRSKTFCRIQSRIALMYLAEIYVAVEWPLRFIVNLLFIMTMPVWIGIVYVVLYLKKAWDSKKNVERQVLFGQIWFYDSFKQW